MTDAPSSRCSSGIADAVTKWQEARKAFLAVNHASPKDYDIRKSLFDRLADAEGALAKLDPRGAAQEAVDCGSDLCNKSLARREEAGKAGAEPVERTSSELNHSPSGNLVPSRDSERKQHEPALEPGTDKSEKGASPRSADEPLTNASGLRALHPLITNICSRHMGELMDPRACAWEIISRCERALALSLTHQNTPEGK